MKKNKTNRDLLDLCLKLHKMTQYKSSVINNDEGNFWAPVSSVSWAY